MQHEFSPRSFEKYSNISFMKIHPLGAKLFHVDKQDMTKLIIGFCNFVNAPRNELKNTTHFLATTYVRIAPHLLALQSHQAPVFIQIYSENFTEHSTIVYNYNKFT
jgi:hypothetical protein